MTITNRIIELLKKNNITAKDYSEKIGMLKSPVTDWKSGKSKPTTDIIYKTCELFNVSADFLLFGKEPPISELTSDQQEILSLWNKLDPIKQAEFKGELKGYIKAKEEK